MILRVLVETDHKVQKIESLTPDDRSRKKGWY